MKRTGDSQAKAPLSALAARRLRQQRAATEPTSNGSSPAITPGAEADPTPVKQIANGSQTDDQLQRSPATGNATKEQATATTPLEPSSDSSPRQVSNFTQTGDNYVYNAGTEETTFKLRRGESIVIQGEYRVSVISGAITICGAVLDSSSSALDVVAPSTQALPTIECAPKSKKRKVDTRDGEYDAVFSVQSLQTGLSEVGRICPRFDRIWRPPVTTTTITGGKADSFTCLLSSPQPPTALTVPPSWQSTIANLSSSKGSPRSIFIVGAKSAGKSTFTRCLTNAITSHSPSRVVAYLDLDPGQPSFTPPCILSLHEVTSPIVAPSFAGPRSTELLRQHHTGYISPREDPKYYLRCAADLFREHRARAEREGEQATLIVNTCGWIKGMGRELLYELVQLCEPTDVVGLGDVDGVFTELLPAGSTARRHLPEAAGTGATAGNGSSNGSQPFTPADLRMLQTIAYFHSLPCTDSGSSNGPAAGFDFGRHLTAVPPLLAGYSGPGSVIHGLTVLDTHVARELLFTAVNATIVAINLVKADDADHPVNRYLTDAYPLDRNAGNEYEGENRNEDNGVAPYIASSDFDSTSSLIPAEDTMTIGLAILRGVDEEKGQVQLLTPVGEDELNAWVEKGYRVVLCRGRDEMPVWLMWDWRSGQQQKQQQRRGADGKRVPYLDFVVGGEVTGKGAKEWKVRRNIMRRGQRR
ncbi:Polynucleotide 5'-hydroxyl-kinase grc3 [Orbilia brochopaga]|uniref:Polynucleotide 5'-hydroxyl-kinase GRC3 n=1 Tax=Orbilia brochopaga TaxID=3140254 RepID=A0AAV9UZL5_9PEZI